MLNTTNTLMQVIRVDKQTKDQLTERILKTYSKEQVQDIIVKLVIGG